MEDEIKNEKGKTVNGARGSANSDYFNLLLKLLIKYFFNYADL